MIKTTGIYLFLFFLIGTKQVYASAHTIIQDTIVQKDSILNIRLHEVSVIAHENYSSGTSSVIKEEAIRHIQPFSLSELMQLLPGGITPTVSFLGENRFTIRHLGTTSFNSLGTGLSIDGVRINTNADFREQSADNRVYGHLGIDTREIPAENIESMEVIRGIPSVRYGDITSGMVVVHTRKNISPYMLSIRLTPGIKSFAAAKGIGCGEHGTMNLNAGYTRANNNIATSLNIYHRITFGSDWYYKKHLLSLEAGLTGTITVNNNPKNLLLLPGEYMKQGNQGFRLRFSGSWQAGLAALTSVEWKGSLAYSHSMKEENRKHSGIYSVGNDATDDGEREAFFIPPQYWDRYRLISNPLNATLGISAQLRKSNSSWNSRTTFGAEWNSDGNRGSGKTLKLHTPSLPSGRQYDFRDIPSLHYYAVYLEENFKTGQLSMEGGVRVTGISLKGHHFRIAAEPRLNLNYTVRQQAKSLLRLLRLHAGVGILRKMPTLNYLYKEPYYKDILSYRYRDEDSGNALAIVTTKRIDLAGANTLVLPRNLKIETGISGLIGSFSFDITGFYEQLNNGFYTSQTALPISYRNYNQTTGKDLSPEYRNGEVYVNDTPVGYTNDTLLQSVTSTTNNFYEKKWGIEFVLRSDYIPPLATTFILDGAWICVHNGDSGLSASVVQQTSGNRSYPMCPFYDNNASINQLQRFNTTLRAVTEIKPLRLITTLAIQSVWMEKSREKILSQRIFYMKDENGNAIYDNLNKDNSSAKYMIPSRYMDTQGNIQPFLPEMASDAAYVPMIKVIHSRKFMPNSYAPYFLVNLRVTKEIGKHTEVTFFANNLASINPKRYNESNSNYTVMNPPPFFGAEIQIRL